MSLNSPLLPPALRSLVQEFSKLPGVGERSALRYAMSLLRSGKRHIDALKTAVEGISHSIETCPKCHFWMEDENCAICEDDHRQNDRLCVVRDCPDVLALEKFRKHSWRYHVLGALLSPLSGIGPSQLRWTSLMERLEDSKVSEVILALDATVEGDATALFLKEQIQNKFPEIKVTRTAMGLPSGSSLEFLDASTLENALAHRTTLE